LISQHFTGFDVSVTSQEILEGLELCQASAQEASGCSAGWQLRVQRAQEMLLRCPVAENQQARDKTQGILEPQTEYENIE
jgi:hypothetical protein